MVLQSLFELYIHVFEGLSETKMLHSLKTNKLWDRIDWHLIFSFEDCKTSQT